MFSFAARLRPHLGPLPAVLALPGLAGCVGAVAEGADMTRDRVVLDDNIAAAQAGDAVAQYKAGEALCCSFDEVDEFCSTPQSVAWLCRSPASGATSSAADRGGAARPGGHSA